MYQPPQTFFYDESPPTSPVERRSVPTVQISAAPKLQVESADPKMEHRRWKSVPGNKVDPAPFSYEYTFKDGKFAGLAEFHPDQDYLHYSSSPGTSRSASRNASNRTSRDVSGRPSLEVRTSTSTRRSQVSQGPPPSPKKTDVLKRALSLRSLKGRAGNVEKKSSPKLPPSPFAKLEIEQFAATFGPNWAGPQHITSPITSPPSRTPLGFYEGPRPAPSPPIRSSPKLNSQPETFREVKPNFSAPLNFEKARKHDSAEPVKAPSMSKSEPVGMPGVAITSPIRIEIQPDTQPSKRSLPPQPLLRRKTSKFVEHIDGVVPSTAEVGKKEQARKPRPTPIFLPRLDKQLSPSIHDTPRLNRTASPMRSMTVKTPRSPVSNLGPWEQTTARKRSASNMKTLPPAPGPSIKRSMSTRTRPPPMMSDICMAQIRPAILGPVVASGHARMISC